MSPVRRQPETQTSTSRKVHTSFFTLVTEKALGPMRDDMTAPQIDGPSFGNGPACKEYRRRCANWTVDKLGLANQ